MFSDTGCPGLSDLPGFYLPAPVRSPERRGSCGRRRNFRDSLPPGRLSGRLKEILRRRVHQPAGVILAGIADDLLRRAAFDYFTVVHHKDSVAERLHQSQIVTDKKKTSFF